MHKPNGSSSQERGWCGEQSPLQARIFERILGDGPSLNVVFICLADPSQEMDGIGIAEFRLERLEYVSLRLENVVLGVG